MRFIYTVLLIGLLESALAQLPNGFVEKQVARNLNPTGLAFSPDGRLFVIEKDGKIREVVKDVLSSDPFMTVTNVDVTNERGLSGLCFHPDFPRTPYFYVYYTVKNQNHNRLSRFRAPNGVADPASETILIDFDPLVATVHNAGVMRFGPDRKLYVATGEGTNASAAQSLTTLLGKVLRLNDDGSVPADNPFAGQLQGNYRAIYALGLRNPFCMDIDPVTGRILVGDVGDASFEEINDIRAGKNYGWPLIEGRRNGQEAPENYADPLQVYDHNTGCAITGMALYNPPTLRFPAEYRGKAFFADYCNGTIYAIDPANGQINGAFVTDIDRPVGIATSPDGYVYYLARSGFGGGTQQDNTSTWNGSLHKVSFFDSGLPYISSQSSNAFVPVGESITFSVNAVGQKPLAYKWYQNGKLIAGADQSQYTIGSPTLANNGATFYCVVSNALGADSSDAMGLRVVQAQRPVARIQQPVTNKTYRAGDVLTFAGDVLNVSQQPVANARLTWWIDFHHDDHVHPALDPVSGITTGTFKIPRVGETSTEVWYRIHLLATDVSGLTNETFVDVKPELATVTIASSVTGVRVYLDGEPRQPDLTFQSVVGMLRSLETKPYAAASEGFYKFIGWGNGQNAPLVTYEVQPGTPTLTMQYQALPASSGNGLLGEYYGNTDQIGGVPTYVRTDETINFDWGEGEPAPNVGADHFVVRWTGKIQVPFNDTYTFYTQTDDGVRLWVNNRQLIDKWEAQPSIEWLGKIDLVAGQSYTIQMDFLESQGYATSKLFWSSPQFEKSIISKPYLFSGQVVTATETEIEKKLTVFPSPAREQITVRYNAQTKGTVQLSAADLLGRMTYNRSVRMVAGTNEYGVSVADWPAGLYLITLQPVDQPAIHQRLLVR